jgi:hypothetical protein
MLIPLFILSLVVKGQSDFVRYGLVAVLLFVSPISYGKTNQAIAVGRSGYEHLKNNEALKNSFAEIPHHITEQKTLILWCYREYDYGNSAQALLPFSTLGNHPIMYTTNITDPNADPETKFARHNKLKVDYILSRHAISWPNLKQVHETEFYHLYKLLD